MIRPFPRNDAELRMTDAQFQALPQAAMDILIEANCQRWEFRNRETGEYGVTVYLPAAMMPRLLAACRPALEETR